jgi:hypothetical protein
MSPGSDGSEASAVPLGVDEGDDVGSVGSLGPVSAGEEGDVASSVGPLGVDEGDGGGSVVRAASSA